jgi:hypothetical protein
MLKRTCSAILLALEVTATALTLSITSGITPAYAHARVRPNVYYMAGEQNGPICACPVLVGGCVCQVTTPTPPTPTPVPPVIAE